MSTEPASKPAVVIAGATGFVGRALAHALAPDHRVIGLSRGERAPDADVAEWRACDLFSLLDAERALEGADLAVYLVHSMMPSAHLTQGSFRDFDLVCADNFARAAKRAGARQIVYLGDRGEPVDGLAQSHLAAERADGVEQGLGEHADAAVDVAGSAEIIVHGGEGEGGLGVGGGGLHGDLRDGVEVDAQGLEVREAVGGDEVREGAPDPGEEREVARRAGEVGEQRARAEGREQRRVVEERPERAGEGLLTGEEGREAVAGRTGEGPEARDELISPSGHGQGELRRAELDEGVGHAGLDGEVVAVDPAGEELAVVEAREEGGAALEAPAPAGEGGSAAAGVFEGLAEDDAGALLGEREGRAETAEACSDDGAVVDHPGCGMPGRSDRVPVGVGTSSPGARATSPSSRSAVTAGSSHSATAIHRSRCAGSITRS